MHKQLSILFSILIVSAIAMCFGPKRTYAQEQKTKTQSTTSSSTSTSRTATPAKQTVAPAKKIANGLTVEQVIQLVQAGLGEDLIIAKIKKNGKSFDLSAEQMLQLKKVGASDNIVLLLMDPTAQPKTAQLVLPPTPIPAEPTAKPVEKPAIPESKPESKEIAVQPLTPKLTEPPANAEDFKRLLKERYDQKILSVMVPGLMAGEFKKAFAGIGQGDAGLMWYHYHENIPIPDRKRSNPLKLWGKKSSDMDQLDTRTFADLDSGLNISPIQRGETLKVTKYYCVSDYVQFDLVVTKLSHMKDLDMQKASTETTTVVRGNNAQQTMTVGTFGLRFKFFFDKETTMKNNDYQTIISEIDKYLLPKNEAAKIISAEQNVEIEPGTSEEVVIQKLGQPLKSIKVGNQKSLKYKDMTVLLKDGRVTEIKLD